MLKLKKTFLIVSTCVLLLTLFSVVAYGEGENMGVVTGDLLNVRESPDTSAKVITQLRKDTVVKIEESSDGWHKIVLDGATGWVHGQYVDLNKEITKTGLVKGNSVNVRNVPGLESEVLFMVDKGLEVEVLDESGDWYHIKLSDGRTGFISKLYVIVSSPLASRGSGDGAVSSGDSSQSENTESTQQKIVNYARKFLGVKYKYGGSSPDGFDCSGFVQYVFKEFGVKLERVAASQSKHGVKVDKGSLKVGDLVFFDTNGGKNSIEHVGIYIGNGNFIHSSSGRNARKVIISTLNQGFYADTYMTARRYIE